MPINRPDGRHWCAPEREEPDADGQWTCPDCGTVWLYEETLSLWETEETRQDRLTRIEQEILTEEEQ